mmetsp:Transcript_22987/g.67742  ORF Transcript_22987/g.67742 Transcript_22987/m.67742 type:complete len:336 (+) Transcript_22987:2313-3320(+)
MRCDPVEGVHHAGQLVADLGGEAAAARKLAYGQTAGKVRARDRTKLTQRCVEVDVAVERRLLLVEEELELADRGVGEALDAAGGVVVKRVAHHVDRHVANLRRAARDHQHAEHHKSVREHREGGHHGAKAHRANAERVEHLGDTELAIVLQRGRRRLARVERASVLGSHEREECSEAAKGLGQPQVEVEHLVWRRQHAAQGAGEGVVLVDWILLAGVDLVVDRLRHLLELFVHVLEGGVLVGKVAVDVVHRIAQLYHPREGDGSAEHDERHHHVHHQRRWARRDCAQPVERRLYLALAGEGTGVLATRGRGAGLTCAGAGEVARRGRRLFFPYRW